MNANLSGGKPYRSRLRELLPEAVALRRTGATWARIAASLSERTGEKVPLATLHDAATRWLRRRAYLDALPVPPPGTAPLTAAPASLPSDPPAGFPPRSGPGVPPPWDDILDEPSRGPVIKINRNSKAR